LNELLEGKMKKQVILTLLLIALAIILVLPGCSQPSISASPAPSTSTQSAAKPPPSSAPVSSVAAPASSAPAQASSPSVAASKPASYPAQAGPKAGGTLRMIYNATPGSPFGWPPEIVLESTSVAQIMLEGMLRIDSKGIAQPVLATSWDVAPDKSAITFHLRKGVKFHDDTDFNAQAVKFNYDAEIQAKKVPFWSAVEVVDDYTVKVKLNQWRNYVLNTFGNSATGWVISPTAYNKNGLDWVRFNPVGTGPFKFDSYKKDVNFKTVKNKNYWNTGKPYLDSIEYVYVADLITQKMAMQSGQGDAMVLQFGKASADMQALNLKVAAPPQNTATLFPDSMNANSPLSNQKVREAIEYAINREAIAKGMGFGQWQAPYQLPPRGGPVYDPNFALGRKYDLAKAKQLLADAGYAQGLSTKIYFSPSGVTKGVEEAIQADLALAGVKVELVYPDMATYTTYLTGSWNNGFMFVSIPTWPNYNRALVQYFLQPDAGIMKSVATSAEFKAALQASITSIDADVALQRKATDQLIKDATVIPINEGGKGYAFYDYVKDAGFCEQEYSNYWNVDLAWLNK
jgi:peptide/nickel transport system substrate-binding protein